MVLLLFMGGFDHCLILQRELKNRGLMGINPARWEHSCGIYRWILMDNFQRIRIEGGGEYKICGQDHDPRNWNWKPWQHLEGLCRKRGLDDFAVRDILF